MYGTLGKCSGIVKNGMGQDCSCGGSVQKSTSRCKCYKVQMICMVSNASECEKRIYFAVSSCRRDPLVNTLAYHSGKLRSMQGLSIE